MIEIFCFTLAACFFSLLMIRALSFGILSPYFILILHLFLAVYIRFLVLFYYDEGLSLHFAAALSFTNFIFLIVAIFVLVFGLEAGIILFQRGSFMTKVFMMPKKIRNTDLIAFLCIAFIFLYLSILINSLGDLAVVAQIFASRAITQLEGLSYLSVFNYFTLTASVILYYSCKTERISNTRKAVYYTCIFMCFTLLLFQSGRGNFVQYCLSLFLISYFLSEKKSSEKVKQIFFLLSVGVFILFSGLAVRLGIQENISFLDSIFLVVGDPIATISNPFALYDSFALSVDFLDKNPNDFDFFYLYKPLELIPRFLWSDKPEVMSITMRQFYWGDSLGGIPPGMFGEALISLGWGMFLYIFSIGIVFGWFTTIFSKINVTGSLLPFIALFTPIIVFNLPRSGFDIVAVKLFYTLVSFFFFKTLASIRWSSKEIKCQT